MTDNNHRSKGSVRIVQGVALICQLKGIISREDVRGVKVKGQSPSSILRSK